MKEIEECLKDYGKNPKIKCACGAIVRTTGMARHLRTNKHISHMKGKDSSFKLIENKLDDFKKNIEICSCGSIVKTSYFKEHLKTKKHQKLMSSDKSHKIDELKHFIVYFKST